MARPVLITGAAGLLGRHVLAHWDVAIGHPVVVEHRDDDLLIEGVAQRLVSRLEPSCVLHLAWTASGTPGYRQHPDNDRWVTASLELAGVARAAGAEFLGTGTALDDGSAADAYSSAKVRLRHALEPDISAGRIGWLRPHYVLQPEAQRPELVRQALLAREGGRPLELRTPDSLHDFVHADDVGRAIVLAVRHALRGVVDIGSGTLRSVSGLVDALGVPWQTSGTAGPPALHHHHAADVARLRSLGWRPTTTEELFSP